MKILLVALLSLLLSGCIFGHSVRDPVHLSEVQPIKPSREVEITMSRKTLDDALAKGDVVNTVRPVEVFRRSEGAVAQIPEYRLFDIQKGSVFDIIGIQNADVLQAVNDYIVYKPEGFKTYVLQVMRNSNESTINLTRSGVAMLLKYKIVP